MSHDTTPTAARTATAPRRIWRTACERALTVAIVVGMLMSVEGASRALVKREHDACIRYATQEIAVATKGRFSEIDVEIACMGPLDSSNLY